MMARLFRRITHLGCSFIFFSDLLIQLGYAVRGSPNRDTVTVKSSSSDQNEKARRVKFQDSSKATTVLNKVAANQGGSAGRQLVPGLLLVQQDSKGKSQNRLKCL